MDSDEWLDFAVNTQDELMKPISLAFRYAADSKQKADELVRVLTDLGFGEARIVPREGGRVFV